MIRQIESIHTNAEAAFVASLSADQQAKYAMFLTANPMCRAIGLPMRKRSA